MTLPLPLNLFRIEATFHPENIGVSGAPLLTYSGDITPDREVSVPAGIALIVFNLNTSPSSPIKALFQTSPVQWFETQLDGTNSRVPTLLPDMFMFQRIGDTTVTLLDFNSNQLNSDFDKNHWFNLVLSYDGATYGSDPMIINEPPVG
ncbi:MAG TPA: hypothetical protein VMM92_10615 [Thermoanaerobaculia bacterium]|nr:hypothetical protein [Thermoanaerobaculia bacterium]